MITKERYNNLKRWCELGANLAPVDFRNIDEYETTQKAIKKRKQKDRKAPRQQPASN